MEKMKPQGASAVSAFIRGQFITHPVFSLLFCFLFFPFLLEYCFVEIVSSNWTEFGFFDFVTFFFFSVFCHTENFTHS